MSCVVKRLISTVLAIAVAVIVACSLSAPLPVFAAPAPAASDSVASVPASAPSGEQTITIAAGAAHSMAVKTDGSLWAWGNNYTFWNTRNGHGGQIGDGTRVDRHTPIMIMDEVSIVAAGAHHSLALKIDGSLWAWGGNSYGELGDGTTEERLSPVKVMDDVRTIAAGYSYSMAVKSDGTLWVWGYNYSGQLGDGTKTNRRYPVKIMDGVSSIAAGGWHAMTVKSDGTLWAWGENSSGQIGDGTTEDRNTPVKIMDDVSLMAAGGRHSFAVKADGSLWAWGENERGQLGDVTIDEYRLTPVKIMDSVSSITAGGDHSMAVKTDGSLWVWGDNKYGQLGNWTKMYRNSPVKLMDEVCSIAAGSDHSIAVKTDGSLWVWGNNEYGQIGNGEVYNRRTPVKIMDNVILPIALPPAQFPDTTPTGEAMKAKYDGWESAYYSLIKAEIAEYGISRNGADARVTYARLIDFDNNSLPELLLVRAGRCFIYKYNDRRIYKVAEPNIGSALEIYVDADGVKYLYCTEFIRNYLWLAYSHAWSFCTINNGTWDKTKYEEYTEVVSYSTTITYQYFHYYFIDDIPVAKDEFPAGYERGEEWELAKLESTVIFDSTDEIYTDSEANISAILAVLSEAAN